MAIDVELSATSVQLKSWTPKVDPQVDYRNIGLWEAWQHDQSKDWIAWNRATGSALVFSDRPRVTAREQAAAFCKLASGEIDIDDPQARTWKQVSGKPQTREIPVEQASANVRGQASRI